MTLLDEITHWLPDVGVWSLAVAGLAFYALYALSAWQLFRPTPAPPPPKHREYGLGVVAVPVAGSSRQAVTAQVPRGSSR